MSSVCVIILIVDTRLMSRMSRRVTSSGFFLYTAKCIIRRRNDLELNPCHFYMERGDFIRFRYIYKI